MRFQKSASLLRALSCASLLVTALTAFEAHASRNDEIQSFLRSFQSDPVRTMNSRIPKRDQAGNVLRSIESRFSRSDIQGGDYISHRDSIRKKMCMTTESGQICLDQLAPGRAPFDATTDNASRLVDNGRNMVRTLEQMESQNLQAATLDETPWSDDYWPIYKGVLGNRYADRSFPAATDWKKNYDYVSKSARTATAIFSTLNASSIDTLSPSEKYDLLVGDSQGNLTAAMWEEGNSYYASTGKVEEWMGICHGWAPAAFMLPRPTHSVTLTAADEKTKIKFYPSDIKSLGSLLWAKTSPGSRFIGGRCNDKNPKMDSNGRVTSADCFDTNPGTWHLAVVNQLGVSKRSLVIDATYDYEVWNQPVAGYRYSYFNPETESPVNTLAEAKVAVSAFTKDKFKSYRSPRAVAVVGVAMDVTYVIETSPSHNATDSAENDATRTARYMYDLELDAQGRIIGGEWYQNLHPDFLWVPAKTTHARAASDLYVTGNWDGKGSVPKSWQEANQAGASQGQPIGKLVELLFTLSRLNK